MAINPYQAPTDYFEMFAKRDAMRAAQAEAEQSALVKQQEIATKMQLASDLQSASSDGTQKAWLGMIAKYPQFKDAFAHISKTMGEEKANAEFYRGMEISNALENGRPDLAAEKLKMIIEARKGAGEETGSYEKALSDIESGDVKPAQNEVNMSLAILDPEKYKKIVEAKVTSESAGSMVDKAKFDAQRAGFDVSKTASEAQTAAAKAEFARKQEMADLKQKAASTGLSQANINKVIMETKKAGIEVSKAALDLEAWKKTGGNDPQKAFDNEKKLREEMVSRNKLYNEMGQTYRKIEESSKLGTGTGDVALIFGFMKMLDPGSVVRETEFATARDTAGLFEKLQVLSEKVKNGETLSERQRKEFTDLASKYYAAAQEKADKDRATISTVVKNYGLNPENVFTDPVSTPGNKATSTTTNRNVTVDW